MCIHQFVKNQYLSAKEMKQKRRYTSDFKTQLTARSRRKPPKSTYAADAIIRDNISTEPLQGSKRDTLNSVKR